MATLFDTATYPLLDSTRLKPSLGTTLLEMDDGTPRLHLLTLSKPVDMALAFSPMNELQSVLFHVYLLTNLVTEFDIVENNVTYRGFIDGDSLDRTVTNGVVHWWKVRFRGVIA